MRNLHGVKPDLAATSIYGALPPAPLEQGTHNLEPVQNEYLARRGQQRCIGCGQTAVTFKDVCPAWSGIGPTRPLRNA